MGTEPQPVTLAEVVRRAVEICDPGQADEVLGRLLEHFEDADEPVSAILDDLERRLADAVEDVDVELDDPSIAMATAVIQYLARRRDELDGEADEILRLAARAEWHGDPPRSVEAWLSDRGVDV
jgi:vacuolar-type H+-ATPase subunit H